jgi:hypothetical protein
VVGLLIANGTPTMIAPKKTACRATIAAKLVAPR